MFIWQPNNSTIHRHFHGPRQIVAICILLIFIFMSASKASAITIWVGSMNVENQVFDDRTLSDLLKAQLPNFSHEDKELWSALDNQLPEVLVIACQECRKNIKNQFAGEQLQKAKRLPSYTLIDFQIMRGTTKAKALAKGLSHIYIGVLVKTALRPQFTDLKKYQVRPHRPKLKGATFVEFTYQGRVYAFGSVHLDASSEENRERGITAIASKLTENGFLSAPDIAQDTTIQTTSAMPAAHISQVQPVPGRAVVLIGDFNYRMIKSDEPAKNQPEFLIRSLSAPSQVEPLRLRDSLHKMLQTGRSFKGHSIDVPSYTTPIAPTYKREYGTIAQKNACRNILSKQGEEATQAWQDCYFSGNNTSPTETACISNEDRCINFGWLDRIATIGVDHGKAAPLCEAHPFLIGDKILTMLEYSDAPAAALGDHSGIWATFQTRD